jgi:hypothetical protein
MRDPRITEAKSLEDLQHAMHAVCADFAADLLSDDNDGPFDLDPLPTFGGEALPRTEGLFSWDAENVLVGDTWDDAIIVSRGEHRKAMDGD